MCIILIITIFQPLMNTGAKVLPDILMYDEYRQFIQFDGRDAQELLRSGSELFAEAKTRVDR